jgi:hypothetical protein
MPAKSSARLSRSRYARRRHEGRKCTLRNDEKRHLIRHGIAVPPSPTGEGYRTVLLSYINYFMKEKKNENYF